MQAPIHLLYAYSVFIRSENMEAAALRLGITQPALSKQLQLLQEHFPQPLLTSRGRSKVPTALGEELGKMLATQFNDLGNEIDLIQNAHLDPQHVRLKIAARKEVLEPLAPLIDFPGALEFLDLSSEQMGRALLNREVQIAITQSPPSSHDLASQKGFSDRFIALVPKNHFKKTPDWNGKTWEILRDIHWLSYSQSLPLNQDLLPDVLQGLKPHRTYSNWRSLLQIALYRDCWLFSPQSYLNEQILKKYWVVDLPTNRTQKIEFSIVYLKDYSKHLWFKDLVRNIQDHLADSLYSK